MARKPKTPAVAPADAEAAATTAPDAPSTAPALAQAPEPPPPLQLPSELTIYTASETRAAWLSWLSCDAATGDADGLCTVDGGELDEIDAAGAQLLVALAHSLARQQLRLRLTNPSRPLRAACRDLGLAPLLLGEPALEARA
jgi:anti-anti-sigma regulatory factor